MSAVKWGLSVLDWHHHAINDRAVHPIGVFKAECGHNLMMITELRDEAYGRLCPVCAVTQGLRAVIHPVE